MTIFDDPVATIENRPEIPPVSTGGIRNSSTTRRAALVASRPAAGRQCKKVLQLLVAWADRGGTDEEIQQELGLNGSSQRPRRSELVKAGLVEDSGRVRPTTSGRCAVVWRATEKALSVLEVKEECTT